MDSRCRSLERLSKCSFKVWSRSKSFASLESGSIKSFKCMAAGKD